MKIFIAVTMYDGEPTVFVARDSDTLYEQVWHDVVEDWFEDEVEREPGSDEGFETLVNVYFKSKEASESSERIYVSVEELP